MVKRSFALLWSALVCGLVFAAPGGSGTTGPALAAKFSSTTNTVELQEILASLPSVVPQKGKQAPQWAVNMISTAINHENPVVVAEAAVQACNLNLTQYSSQLVAMYKNAEIKYQTCGYVDRVRYSIITALGKLAGSEAKSLISAELKNDNATNLGELLLNAITEINDPAFISDLENYKIKMQGLIDQADRQGLDPIIKSIPLYYVQLATEIQKTLSIKGGK